MAFADLLGAPSVEGTGRSKIPSSENTSSLSLTSSSESTAVTTPEHIEEEAYIMDPDPERPDLRELNACLHALAAIFPNIQIEVFRDMLASFDGESRLSLVTDALLKNDVSWVKGRWRVTTEEGREEELVPKKETFRSPEYKQAVKSLAWREFKGLSRSAINAVLAENNYSYLDARQTLVDLSSKSWRFTISSLFRRRKPVSATEAENHPLVIWKTTDQGSVIPTLKSTGHAELDQELFTALITPLKERARAALEAEDRKMAAHLNNLEAEQAGSMIECACCFTEAPFEEFTSCTDRGHMLCVQCVKRCISEAVFGQGWQRSINNQTGCLRCFAPSGKKCKGDISRDHMERAMSQDSKDPEILRQLEDRLADYSVAASNLPLVRCHFCGYAEVDDTYQPVTRSDFRFRTDQLNTFSFIILAICCIPWVVPFAVLAYISLTFSCFVLISVACYNKTLVGVFMTRFVSEMRSAVIRRRERGRGLRFSCRRPSCRRKSCIRCEKGWTDVHVCHMSSLEALRTQVEQAMSFAVKRVCPRCNTSFVRASGCNKMRCPCGYEMCYICRADISGKTRHSTYQHFCNHFWQDPTKKKCTECTKCSLYEVEEEELVLRKAREAVEKRWQSTEKRELTRAELVYLERSLPPSEHWGLGEAVAKRRLPRLSDVCDVLLMTFFAPSP